MMLKSTAGHAGGPSRPHFNFFAQFTVTKVTIVIFPNKSLQGMNTKPINLRFLSFLVREKLSTLKSWLHCNILV